MAKDLGEGLESLESEIESLKTKDFRLFGVKINAVSISAALTLVASLIGSLYGGFILYKDYMDMKEIIQNIDTDAIAARNDLIEQKLDDAIDYTQSIKNDLRDQIRVLDDNVRLAESRVRDVEGQIRDSETTIRQIVRDAEANFDAKRDSLQNQYDNKASALRDTTDQKIKDVEDRLNAKLQRALDNPLAN